MTAVIVAGQITPGFVSPYDFFQGEEVDEFGGIWQLSRPLVYRSAVLARLVTVPKGFQTDFASVPRLPFVYIVAGHKADRAATVHDWLYSTECVDRATADAVLREAMLATGYSAALAGAFYAAVRAFGGSHWMLENLPQAPDVAAAMNAEPALA